MAASEGWSSHKSAGNAAYTGGRTAEACEHYTRALQCTDVPPADRATLLCNRAQAYLKLNKNEAAVEDCTACLTLSPDNVKALFRRCARGERDVRAGSKRVRVVMRAHVMTWGL